MEGPSLFIAQERLQPFVGKKILTVSGNDKLDHKLFAHQEVRSIFSWGKHLVFQFDHFALRVHFMLFGSYEAIVNGETFFGDYPPKGTPRLAFEFDNGKISMHDSSMKIIEGDDVRKFYDFSLDVLSPEWDSAAALSKVEMSVNTEVGDVLLNQDIFAGVGNVIRNETLWLNKIPPTKKVQNLSTEQLEKIIDTVKKYTKQFYEWHKVSNAKDHANVYRKEHCPTCGTEIIREKTGKTQRWSYYCPVCQA